MQKRRQVFISVVLGGGVPLGKGPFSLSSTWICSEYKRKSQPTIYSMEAANKGWISRKSHVLTVQRRRSRYQHRVARRSTRTLCNPDAFVMKDKTPTQGKNMGRVWSNDRKKSKLAKKISKTKRSWQQGRINAMSIYENDKNKHEH